MPDPSRRPRIAHVTWTYGGTQEGISRSVTELVRDQRSWADVAVLAARVEDDEQGVQVVPVALDVLDRRLPFALGFARASARTLRRLGPFDMVHAHVPTLARPDVATVHLFPPRKLIALVRETMRRTGQDLPTAMARRFRLVGLTSWTYARNIGGNTALIAVSPRVAAALVDEYGLDPRAAHTIPLGITPPDTRVRPGLRPDTPRRVALFVGHQFVTKGLGFAIDALVRLGDAAPYLVVIGEGSEGSLTAMRDYATARGLSGQIRFDGVQRNVGDYYAMADMLIYPTFFDTFGLVIGEALAAGLPVVTTRAAGITDLLDASPALQLVDTADDVAGLACAIGAIPARGLVSKTSRDMVSGLTWAAHGKAVRELYRAVRPDIFG